MSSDNVCKEDKEIESFDKKLTTYTAAFVAYGVIVGAVFNYMVFNHMLGFDIFGYLEPMDFIFSWISNETILQSLIPLLILTLILCHFEKLSYNKTSYLFYCEYHSWFYLLLFV